MIWSGLNLLGWGKGRGMASSHMLTKDNPLGSCSCNVSQGQHPSKYGWCGVASICLSGVRGWEGHHHIS